MSVTPATMRRLMRELADLKKSPPEGIRVQTSDDNMLDVTGIIEGPEGTPYAGGYFRVKFKFAEEFPGAPPKCWFATKIFHPNVSTAGEICVNTLKKDWKPEYGIGHILLTVKCLLIYPNPESALDEEAGKLLLEDYKSYCSRAKLITSVHARGRPAEFDQTSGQSAKSSKATASSSSAASNSTSINPVAASLFSLPLPVTSTLASSSTTMRKSSSPAPPSAASQNSSKSNTLSADKDGSNASKEKERHVSPSPLSTADANVSAGAGTAAKPPSNVGMGVPTQTKAVKRAAASNPSSGAEKRKKALKRL